MSEEAANATKAVPYGILMSIGSCWLLGFVIVIVLAACMTTDTASILETPFGQPIAQVWKSYQVQMLVELAIMSLSNVLHRYIMMLSARKELLVL